MLSPVDQLAFQNLKSRGPASSSAAIFEPGVVNAFLKVIVEAIQIEVNMEQIRQKLAKRKDFDVGKAFLTLAADQRSEEQRGVVVKHIYSADVVKLMQKHDHYDSLKPLDIQLLIHRMDLDYDGRIGLNEFYQSLEPQSDRPY